MGIKTSYRVFFAIPFDTATFEMYERIEGRIRAKFGVTTFIGTKEIGPSPSYSDIASFKAQNTDMITQMRMEIEGADIIVADMTHNNPNVHFELGIALYLNKNILRVTGRSLTELGFDIRGLEVFPYKNEENLFQKICHYLDLFLKIKDLPLSPDAGPLYRCFAFDATMEANKRHAINIVPLTGFRMRDGAVAATFSFKSFMDPIDWFGFYLRFESEPILSSYLVYVRQNGFVEVAAYPGTKILAKQLLVPGGIDCEKTLLVELDGDTVKAAIDGNTLRHEGLANQSQGNVWLAAHQSDVFCRSAEAVCRDTISAFPQEISQVLKG
jgi:aromatic ring-cleaving dioxygenase